MTSPEPFEAGSLTFTAEQWAFLRRLNHDLRSPLMTILGTGEMLADGIYGEISPKQQKAVERLLRNSRRVQDLLTYAMTYMRLRADALILNSAPVSTLDLLSSVIAEGRKRTAHKALTIELAITQGMPETLIGDVEQLALIIRELLINAVNFTPSGSVKISVRPDQDHWELTVQDTGIGIAAEAISSLFTAFWRGSEAQTYSPEGHGLGLPVVHGLVAAMGGTIEVQSEVGAGTRITLRLPQVMPARNLPSTVDIIQDNIIQEGR